MKGSGVFAAVGFAATVAEDEDHDVKRAAVSTGAGLLGSIAAGAAVGAVAGSPAFGIGAVPGAVIGAVVGFGVGLYTSGVAESMYDNGLHSSNWSDGVRSVTGFFTDW
ncbi:DUF6861 domain-containing protein [Nostocoides sp. Soil756]|uniref:DUF6861 domain-containing protein n=1 Tax=Nostocoides sp. Soil756 TaxID=1736399 RepID=UPI0006F2FAA8|nr:hypothetical protein ASG78_15545 [Tetrasphaera sp. Soil756]